MAEGTGLLNRRRVLALPRVRIPSSPLFAPQNCIFDAVSGVFLCADVVDSLVRSVPNCRTTTKQPKSAAIIQSIPDKPAESKKFLVNISRELVFYSASKI